MLVKILVIYFTLQIVIAMIWGIQPIIVMNVQVIRMDISGVLLVTQKKNPLLMMEKWQKQDNRRII